MISTSASATDSSVTTGSVPARKRRGFRTGRGRRIRLTGWIVGLLVTLLLAVTLGVSVGSIWIPPSTVWSSVARHVLPWAHDWAVDPSLDALVWELRFPRVLLAVIVGAALGIVGAVLQAAVRNPLADPEILGSSTGASLGAVLVIVGGFGAIGAIGVSAGAFVGAIVALGLVLVFGRSKGRVAPLKLILVGVAVSASMSAMVGYVVTSAPDEQSVRNALYWLLGSLSGARWPQLGLPAVAVAVAVTWLLARADHLNVISIGDESATTLGVNPSRLRIELIAISALLVGTTVAISGSIGFVALVIPHIARLFVGSDHRRLLTIVVLLGALFMVIVDIGSRVLLSPLELPAGIITSMFGGPALLYLLWRREARLRKAT